VTLQRRSLGILGENIAADYLQKKGLQIVERNYRCRLGELDIIARQGGYLVFVEVRTRSSALCGLPQESITATKIKKVRRLAQAYMAQRSLSNIDVRFDVVAVYCAEETTITHIENAF
jgi:putative endonuclease